MVISMQAFSGFDGVIYTLELIMLDRSWSMGTSALMTLTQLQTALWYFQLWPESGI